MTDLICWLLRLSLSGTILAGITWGITALGRRHLPKACLYYCWLFVLIRFVLPLHSPLTLTLPEREAPLAAPVSVTQTETIPSDTPIREISPITPSVIPQTRPVQQTQAQPSPAPSFSPSWYEIAGLVWLAGFVGSLAYSLILYHHFLRRVLPECRKPSASDLALFHELCPKGSVRLLVHTGLPSALHLGLFRPTILLSDSDYAASGRNEALRAILLHELTHYRRRDLWIKWFTMLVSAIHWFNPVMIPLRRSLHEACELACDEAVLQQLPHASRALYGEALLDSIPLQNVRVPLSAGLYFTQYQFLRNRIMHIADFKKIRPKGVIASLVVLALLSGCAAVTGPASVEPTAEPVSSATQEPQTSDASASVAIPDSSSQDVSVVTPTPIATQEPLFIPEDESFYSPVHYTAYGYLPSAREDNASHPREHPALRAQKDEPGQVAPLGEGSLLPLLEIPESMSNPEQREFAPITATRYLHYAREQCDFTQAIAVRTELIEDFGLVTAPQGPTQNGRYTHYHYELQSPGEETPYGLYRERLIADCDTITYMASWDDGNMVPHHYGPQPAPDTETFLQIADMFCQEFYLPMDPDSMRRSISVTEYDPFDEKAEDPSRKAIVIYEGMVENLLCEKSRIYMEIIGTKVVYAQIHLPCMYLAEYDDPEGILNRDEALYCLNFARSHVRDELDILMQYPYLLGIENANLVRWKDSDEDPYASFYVPAWKFLMSTAPAGNTVGEIRNQAVYVNAITGEVMAEEDRRIRPSPYTA